MEEILRIVYDESRARDTKIGIELPMPLSKETWRFIVARATEIRFHSDRLAGRFTAHIIFGGKHGPIKVCLSEARTG